MIKIKLVENDNRIESPVVSATLLSVEEYEENDYSVPRIRESWWLRDAGYSNINACTVDDDGDLRNDQFVNVSYVGIRPVLILNLQSSNLKVKNKFEFGGHIFKIISRDLAICKDFIGNGCFRKDYEAEDANVYEKSDVKKVVDKWLNDSMNKEPNFFNKKNINFMLQNNKNPELKAQLLQINHDLGQDKREEDDLSWLDMSDEEFLKYMNGYPMDEYSDEF